MKGLAFGRLAPDGTRGPATDIFLTGANCGNDYFTNRIDRWYHLQDTKPPPPTSPQPASSLDKIAQHLTTILDCVAAGGTGLDTTIDRWAEGQRDAHSQGTHGADGADGETFIFPLVQVAGLGVRQEEEFLLTFLREAMWTRDSTADQGAGRTGSQAAANERLLLTTPYPNPPPSLVRTLVEPPSAEHRATLPLWLLTASEQANGFRTASGLSRNIPRAYSGILARLLKTLQAAGGEPTTVVREWSGPDQTYHAKGVTFTSTQPGEPPLTVTTVGSSNHSARSWSLDSELVYVIVSTRPSFARDVADEVNRLWAQGKEVTRAEVEARKTSPVIKFLGWLGRGLM